MTTFRSIPSGRRSGIVLLSGLTLALLIGIEELSQQYFSNRTFDLVDLSASYLGVFLFSLLAWRIVRTKEMKPA